MAGYMLAPLVANFRRAYPNVKLEISELRQNDMERQLINRTLDVAITLVLPQLDSITLKCARYSRAGAACGWARGISC